MANDRNVQQMVTAQWLLGGESIYWTGSAWSESFAEGKVYADQATSDAALADADAFVKQRKIVGPYLIEVELDATGPQPTSARERIRAAHNATFAIDHGSWSGRIAD